jgi:exonuclease SbcC
MITRIRLKNWKSHLDSELSFGPGVNALVGIVGSGKSSLMQAITFALFGSLQAVSSRKIDLNELIMSRPARKDRAEVELECELAGKRYQIRRVIERGKGTTLAEIRENGKMLDVNAKNVTAAVERALQMDYELFSKAVYSEQNELDYFLRIPKGKRTGHIDRMLKVERFEQARETAVALKNRVLDRREEKARMLEGMEKDGLGKRIEGSRREIESLSKEMGKLKVIAQESSRKRAELEKAVSGMEGKQGRLNDINTALESIRSALSEMDAGLKKDLPGLEQVRDSMGLIESNIKVLSKQVEDKNRELEDGRDMIASLNTKIKLLREGITSLEKIGAKCPLCESSISHEHRDGILEDKKGDESRLHEKVSRAVSQVSRIRGEKEEIEEKLRTKEAERVRLSGVLDDVKRLTGLERRKKEYLKRASEHEAEKARLEKGMPDRTLNDARKELQEEAARERELAARASSLAEKLSDRKSSLEDLIKRQGELEKYRKEVAGDEAAAAGLDRFVSVLKVTQDQLREEFVKTVNRIMGDVWRELYPYGDFDSIRLAVDQDYTLQLRSSGDWVAVEGIASGGERSMACLALRIAFSHAFIPNLRWLILDEPTHNLDALSVEQLSRVLRERIGSFAEQVFLITHEERISDGMDSYYRLERDKGKNEPTRVVAM